MVFGHVAAGLVAKKEAPKVSLGVLLVAAEALDILWGPFLLTAVEHLPPPVSPRSHGLLMAAVSSLAGGLAAARLYHNRRTSVLVGLVVFSHWILDFASHPMWPSTQPDLRLLLAGSPTVGLGLWRSRGGSIAGELSLLALSVVMYLVNRHRGSRAKS
jgi:hypothetical protein